MTENAGRKEREDEREERGPTRTCVGCRARVAKDELVRLALPGLSDRGAGEGGTTELPEVAVDLSGKLPGRGVHLHPTVACATAAVKRGGLAQALKRAPRTTVDELVTQLADKHQARAMALLGSARRAGRLAMGTEAVREAVAERRVELLVLAHDAAGRREELAAAMGDRVLVLGHPSPVPLDGGGGSDFGSKGALGSMFGREEVAVLGVLDRGLADHVSDAMKVASELRASAKTASQKTEAP